MGSKVSTKRGKNNVPIIVNTNRASKSPVSKLSANFSTTSLHSPRIGQSSSPSLIGTERINIAQNVALVSGFNPTRFANKKQKIVITAKPSAKKRLSEADIL